MKRPITTNSSPKTPQGADAALAGVQSALMEIRVSASRGDPMALSRLVQVALLSIKQLEELSEDKDGLALLKMVAAYFEEFPTTFTNPLYIRHRIETGGFVPVSSADRFRCALTCLVPFKISGSTGIRKKPGKPKKDDLLNQELQFFVRGVCCHAVPDSLAIWSRITEAQNTTGAWAKEFVSWIRSSRPGEIEKPTGIFHKLASRRLEVKNRSQLRNRNGRAYDGGNLWPQFQQVVTRRLGSILSRPVMPPILE